MEEMNVESFNLDHTKVKAPFVRIADVKDLGGATLTKYDVRFCQPNVDHLGMPTIHSIEHSFAEYSRNHASDVVDFSPMGCQTGFYLLRASAPDLESTMNLIETTFRDILAAESVPAANEVQCGWGESHSLEGAQAAVATMLAQRAEWGVVYA
ncbi:S-ribosylhomocysteine lyase [Trueperella bialowiezensis]|uniref:S-ribosylhomocysteine lyase n=1 Tax=Trueperella bialowiezensis TaxID=312285 RepID=A0A448PEP7_9ACTO|nr:S-ribosylhomocysteine lyase [Trueperella bialowiezensis]VEI13374.1 S-ribosylhomocysteine lyase [Trueperella bialowiezensis]